MFTPAEHPVAPPPAEAARDFHFVQFAEASQAFVWLLCPTGQVVFLNGLARRLCGPVTQGSPWRDAWPEDSRFSIDRAVAAAKGGGSFQFRTRYPAPDTDGIYLDTTVTPIRDEGGSVIRLLVAAQDVTTQVESAAFLNTVINVLPLALTVKDLRTDRYVLANRAAEDLFDRPDGLVGLREDEVLPPSLVGQAAGEGAALSGSRATVHRDDHGDAVRYLSAVKIATYDDEGARHLIGLTEDVTQRHLDAEALRKALDQAEQANRAKTAFLNNMSHEIRTPLNGVIAGVDLMAYCTPGQDIGELVDMVRASAAVLDQRLEEVLAISRLSVWESPLEATRINLRALLEGLVNTVRGQASAKALAVEIQLQPGMDGAVLGDVTCLNQALGRLMDNAVKFTERGGVTVGAARLADGQLRFSFTDTGIGFDPALKEQLFASFGQQDPSLTRRFGGLGLGLTTARELVRLMGGTIDAQSHPEGGSTFWMDLPLPAAPQQPRPAAAPEPDESRPLRILIADDHPTNRRVVELMLGEIAEVVSVNDGKAAVEAMNAGPYDLVLMDIQMPVMDGITAVAHIRASEAKSGSRRTPIVMLTANTQDDHVVASRRAGADRMIGKPFTAIVLLKAIQSVLHS